MGFNDNSPEFQACVKLLEATKLKQKENPTETVDLISIVVSANRDSQADNEVLLIEKKAEKKTIRSKKKRYQTRRMRNN